MVKSTIAVVWLFVFSAISYFLAAQVPRENVAFVDGWFALASIVSGIVAVAGLVLIGGSDNDDEI